jgi:phosphoribosylamine--glycine ligase
MKILVIGNGGREHAMAWKLLQSPRVESLVMVPDNAAAIAQMQNQFSGKKISSWTDSIRGEEALGLLAKKVKSEKIDFVVVGPDNALADGAVDIFEANGIPAFGPTKAGAHLESSKIFSKQVMQAAGVPTAEGHEVHSLADAASLIKKLDWKSKQWVLKADGLALGKGVEICETLEQAELALVRLKQYSHSFVIEERLFGKEISWLAFCDGETCSLLAPARDYKTLTEDPLSPNTGGMGAVCPVPIKDATLAEKVRNEVVLPTLREMKKRGTPYKGILYAGLMITDNKYWVLEFNSRFGDPEAQALLPLMKDDLLEWCEASQAGTLDKKPNMVPMTEQVAVYVVAAAPGYPAQPFVGKPITGLDTWIKNHHGFFAGVKKNDRGEWVTSGGRVLGALGLGASIAEARAKAFTQLKEVSFEGLQYREGVGAEWV